MNRYNRSRVDDNQPQIVQAFRALGWYVLHTHDLKNACDLIVVRNGRVIAIEVKNGDLPLSKPEQALHESRRNGTSDDEKQNYG
jgi:hypothetical protein